MTLWCRDELKAELKDELKDELKALRKHATRTGA